VNIEKASVSDAEKILELQKLSYKSEAELYNDFTIPPMIQTIQEMGDDFAHQMFLKVEENGRIIGSVRAYEKDGTCYIGRLVVHPDYQNKGIGTKLMREIENMFKDCRRFELFTGNKSEKNLMLYQKLGYKRFKDHRINDQVSLVYLEKLMEEV
jgi:ribosomal protein S18 acetylase RimI-like enzyme